MGSHGFDENHVTGSAWLPRRFTAALCIGAGLMVGACAGGQRLDATTVLVYDRCQGIDAGLTPVDIRDVASIRGSTLLRMDNPAADAGTGSAGSEPGTGAEAGLLLVAVSRGRQPTPGYGLKLDAAVRRGSTGVIRLDWQTPPDGAVLPQVTTHPCVVVSVDTAALARIEAVDQSGRTIGELDLTR